MKYFAELNEKSIVVSVVRIADESTKSAAGIYSATVATQFCTAITKKPRWVETSKDGSVGKNYAGVGYFYDATRKAFIPPRPFKSWTLDTKTCRWVAPVIMPKTEYPCFWDESICRWVESKPKDTK
jgi:hypothetical protein